MIFAFDLDGTLCETIGNDYKNSKPIYERIEKVNNLFSVGYQIIIYTARGCNSGLTEELKELTKNQLKNWGVKHNVLSMGQKIHFDFLIDDKAQNANDWFEKNKKLTTGFLGSSFDIIHPGYIKILKDAKTVCDHLICALQVNPNIERKFKNTPVHTVDERIEILSAMKYVDEIIVYNTENDLLNLLTNIKPDVRILGTDYKNKTFTGSNLNIKIHWHERNHDYSTSSLRNKIYKQIELDKELNEKI